MTEITTRLSTALADRYRIEREIGEGGMTSPQPEGTCTGDPRTIHPTNSAEQPQRKI